MKVNLSTVKKRMLFEIGDICRRQRENRNMSQLEVGCALGVSQQVISDFENGLNDNYIIFLFYKCYILSKNAEMDINEIIYGGLFVQ